METRAHYVAVGAFVLAVIVLGFVAVLSLGRVEFAQELKRYYIFFKGSVTGLSKGSLVQYNGITVGRVVDVRVDPDDLEKIQVTVEIDNRPRQDQDRRAGFRRHQPVERGRHNPDPRRDPRGQGSRAGARPSLSGDCRRTARCSSSVTEAGPQLLDRLMVAVDNLNAVLDEQNRQGHFREPAKCPDDYRELCRAEQGGRASWSIMPTRLSRDDNRCSGMSIRATPAKAG